MTLDVLAVPLPPIANPDTYTTNENTALSVAAPGVLANDIDPNGFPLAAVLQSSPSHGTLNLSADGSFVYTPQAFYKGPDSFTYLDFDGKLDGNITTVSLTVVPVNQPPTVTSATYSTPEDDTLVVPAPGILATAFDPNGLSLSAVLVNPPQNGTVSLGATGGFTYTANTGFVGTDSFTFKASDANLSSNLGTVTINVTPIPPTTVQLEPSSDTGDSQTDRITSDTTPTFFGTTVPGVQVVLYAQMAGSSAPPTPVGQTIADANGNYFVRSSPISDGLYAFSVAAFRSSGQTVSGTIGAGDLLFDTVPPVITNVVMTPKTGQIYVTFQDDPSGMNLASLMNRAHYSFTRRTTATPRNFLITAAQVVPPVNSPAAPVTVVLTVANGHRILHGRYLFTILAGGITDNAGNQLDGAYSNGFPTGNGLAGSAFDALFLDHGFKPNVPVPTRQFVPVLTKARAIVEVRMHRPGGPLVHLAGPGRGHARNS